MKIKRAISNKFKINQKTGRITFTIKAHDNVFVGISNCSDKDEYDEGKGMRIARFRAEIAYRKFEAQLTQQFIDDLKIGTLNSMEMHQAVSKMYMTTIQSASENLKMQYNRIKILQKRLNDELQ